jgi:4-hydroxy-3-methylbut-2-enyl diphosphate reductase
VAGSPHSSNANRLREAAERCGVRAVLLDSPAEVTPELLAGVRKIGLSAAASTPESQIATLKKALENN